MIGPKTVLRSSPFNIERKGNPQPDLAADGLGRVDGEVLVLSLLVDAQWLWRRR